jgi:hypothetical protein
MQQRGNLRLVGLKLGVGAPDRRVLIRRILQLDQTQRQAVDEDHYIGATMRSDTLTPNSSPRGRGERALDHRELVYR